MQAAASGLPLPEYVTIRVNRALADGKPIVVGYVDTDGRPQLSLRGSVHVHGDRQLALWVRHATGVMAMSLAANPNISLLYRDSVERTTFIFAGKAYVDDDPEVRAAVFEAIPVVEQEHDLERDGVALIVEVERVTGGTVGGFQVPTQS